MLKMAKDWDDDDEGDVTSGSCEAWKKHKRCQSHNSRNKSLNSGK